MKEILFVTSDDIEISMGDTYWYFRDEKLKLLCVTVRSWQDYSPAKGFIQFGIQDNAVEYQNKKNETRS